jgi:hypothetical protein
MYRVGSGKSASSVVLDANPLGNLANAQEYLEGMSAPA